MSKQPLPRAVWLLGGVSFFADISSEMIYPLLPVFVVAVLGGTATELGWIEGVAQAVVAFVAAYAGIRSDRNRRRLVWVRWGYGLPVAGKAILALATTWPLVLLGRMADRVGKGFRGSPRDALIVDATEESQRGRAFGLHRALDTAGALVGVVGAVILMYALGASTDPGPYRVIFAVAAVMGIASLALTFAVREPTHAPTGTATSSDTTLPRAYWIALAMLLVFVIANSSDTFLLLRAANLGLSPTEVVIAYALYNAIYAAISYPAGALSDRIGRWAVLAIGWAIYAIVYAGFALAGGPLTAWILFGAYGGYMALTDGVGKALIADHAPKAARGKALGIFQLATGIGTLASSVIAGLLWDHVDPSAPFWLGAIAAVLALALLPIALRARR